jgi:hypothetical protein
VLIAAERLLIRRRFVKSPTVQDVKYRYQGLDVVYSKFQTIIPAATALMLVTAQPAHAACLIGKSGAKICSGGSVTGASGATITDNACVTGVTGVTLCP